MSLARRAFLRIVAAAPMAAPVIAREAAQKAGISAVGAASQFATGGYGASPAIDNDWVKKWVSEVFTSEWRDERWREIAGSSVGALDPDLASSKSLSLSAAIHIQRQRRFKREVASARSHALRRFKEAFGFDFIPQKD